MGKELKQVRLNPYQYLLRSIKEFCSTIPSVTIPMLWYKKDGLMSGYRLDDLYERTHAAQQLGYEVIVVAKDDGLHVEYRKRIPDIPWGF